MKLFIDLTSLDDRLSGIERYAANITEALLRRGDCELTLVFKNRIPERFVSCQGQTGVRLLVLDAGGRLTATQLKLPALLRRLERQGEHFDACLFPAFPAPLLYCSRKAVSTIHDIGCFDCPEAMTLPSRIFFRTLYRKAARQDGMITTVSEFSKERIADKFPRAGSKTVVVRNGIAPAFLKQCTAEEIAQVREKYRLPERYILSLCTLEPRKQLPLLVSAYKELYAEGLRQHKLVLVGRSGWKNNSLEQMLAGTEPESVVLTGFADDADLPALYAGAALFVFPSMYEGFGLPPLEAMAAGTPVLSSDAASMPEILGEKAHYFRSEDAESLKAQLEHLLTLPREQLRSGEEGRRSHAATYTWENAAQQLVEAVSRNLL
ncbi:MAG: glycosyltransferase family 4 protein [Ruminococcaceae bacterium]|nr:glycosyltransferase family 4 protein [Oscillospiraceae bacterium]